MLPGFQIRAIAALQGAQEIGAASRREALQDRCQKPFRLRVRVGELCRRCVVACLERRMPPMKVILVHAVAADADGANQNAVAIERKASRENRDAINPIRIDGRWVGSDAPHSRDWSLWSARLALITAR